MATYYLPSTGGYSTNSSNVNYRIEVDHVSTTNRVATVTVQVQFWRTNKGYETYGSGTCYCTINGTTYGHQFTSSDVVTYMSMTDFLTFTLDVPYDENGNAQVEVYAWTETTHVSLSTSSHGGTVSLANIGPEIYTLYFKGSTNDAIGYPEAITAAKGTTIIIPSQKPSRTGYTFSKWTTNKDGTGTAYLEGNSFTINEKSFLYAQWTPNTYIVTYNLNGGAGEARVENKIHDVALIMSSYVPARIGYSFVGWGISASSTTVSYSPGDSYTQNASITLYAIWTKEYTAPRIDNVTVYRSDASGKSDDSGSYFKIEFNWSTDTAVKSIGIEWYPVSISGSTSKHTISASGTSGHVSVVLGSGSLSVESSYNVTILVTDQYGSTNRNGTVPSKMYTMDVYPDGTGVAFGKSSEKPNLFEVEWHAKFNKNVTFAGGIEIERYETLISEIEATANTALSGMISHDTRIKDLEKPTTWLNNIYPVGSIYLAYNHTSPADIFGGTWHRISPHYLYAAGPTAEIGQTFGWIQENSSSSAVTSIKIAAWRRIA